MNNVEALTILIPATLGALVSFVIGYLAHKREMKKIDLEKLKLRKDLDKEISNSLKLEIENKVAIKKLEFLPRIMSLKTGIDIQTAVDDIFANTKITRFLILIGVNGKWDLNSVSCVWYGYKDPTKNIDPIREYKNIDISQDNFYRDMLKSLKSDPSTFKSLHTQEMPPCQLKEFYQDEKITFSKVGFLHKEPLDDENDAIIYFSAATDSLNPITKRERNFLRRKVNNSIKLNVKFISELI